MKFPYEKKIQFCPVPRPLTTPPPSSQKSLHASQAVVITADNVWKETSLISKPAGGLNAKTFYGGCAIFCTLQYRHYIWLHVQLCIPIVHDYADMHLSNSIKFKFVLLFSLNLFFSKVKCCTIFTICMGLVNDYAVGWSNCKSSKWTQF